MTTTIRTLYLTRAGIAVVWVSLLVTVDPSGGRWGCLAPHWWAIVAGAIQLAVAGLRLRRVGGQWPMIISGAGSLFAGTTFLDWARSQAAALHALEQYSIGGAIWYAITACWLTFAATRIRSVQIEQ